MILELEKIKNRINYSVDQSFGNEVLEDIRQKRVRYIDVIRDNGFEDGIRNLLTQLYPDNAHFVYELLQNAEDARATRVYFSLQKDCLYFLHNGNKSFTSDDVKAITSIGDSTGANDHNRIGKFGVGFKSVFSYTNTPSVHSSTISFLIKDLMVPSKLEKEEIPSEYTTLFAFPFNNFNKPPVRAYEEIFRLFSKLSDNTLLFLNGIQEISWGAGNQDCNTIKRKDKTGYIEISNTLKESSFWRVFTKKINVDSDDEGGNFDVKIAYAFDKEKNEIIETSGAVSIFFPADSEVSKLKFHIHAPFVSTVARDSIVKNNEENRQLIQGIASLCCGSFYEIKEDGMLSPDFLKVLPNKGDGLSDTYLPIYEKIIAEFENESNDLISIGSGNFSNLESCRFSKPSIKNIFNKGDLKILLNDEDVKGFAVNASQLNNRTDKFYQDLDRRNFYENDLIESLNALDDDVSDKELQDAKHYEDDERLFEIKTKRGWLISKNNEWFQGLYALLFDFSEAWIFDDVSELTSIIKLSDDSFNYLKESVYFLDTEHSDSEFKFVNQATYISGKNKKQQDKSKKFLEYIGVENLDESIHIKLLFENYKFESKEQHIEDINRLIKFYTDENEIDREFREFSFVYTNSNNIVKPSKIAIDSPFEVTGLKYVASYQDTELLNSVYKELHNKGAFLSLIKSLGANDVLVIEKTSIRDNPDRYILVRKAGGARWTDTAINRDWIIEGLDEMLADQEHPREISKLVWNTMCTVSLNSYNEEFKAQYRKNSSYRVQERKSQLIHTLSNANWIPDKDGRFCNPKDIDMELLPLDFVYNNENKWLDLIEFGLNVQFTNDERDNAKELVVSITGMSVEQLEQFKNTGISPERMLELAEKETQRLGDAIDRSQGSGGSEEVDQGGKDNDDEIIINIEEFQKNIGDEYEGMDVQIVDTKVIVKKQNYEQLNSVKEYLYKQYKGHCQICGDTFKKEKDGKYHFVKYSLNRVKKGDVKKKDINRNGNTLSLCPKHHSILKLGLVNFSFSNVLNGQSSSIDIDFIRENFKFSEYLGRDDYKAKNDAFYALPENDNFERGVYLLPIKLFTRIQYLKFTEDHIMHFIKTWNEY